MNTLGKRRGGNPLIRQSDSTIITPKRIPFTQKKFNEGWIQELIRVNPELLPVAEIEAVFSPLIPIGREVQTKVGPIDNLYLSPQGYLTIVETKLWRNPQARREVVGQIIDYAKEVNKWSFDELEERVRSYNQQYRGSNFGIIKTLQLEQEYVEEEENESVFIDSVTRNIQQGRFLLLVVGDGIHESVEHMVDFLAQTPQLQFTLALVELQIYELNSNQDKSLLIIPQIVTRTREITRAIVKVEAKNLEAITIGLVEEKSSDPEEIFFEALGKSVDSELVDFARSIIEDMEDLNCIIEWHNASYVIKLPNPTTENRTSLSIVGVNKYGKVFVTALADQLRKSGLPDQIGFDHAARTASLFKNCIVRDDNPTYWAKKKYPHLKELQQKYNDFKVEVEKTIDEIYNAVEKQ